MTTAPKPTTYEQIMAVLGERDRLRATNADLLAALQVADDELSAAGYSDTGAIRRQIRGAIAKALTSREDEQT